MCDGAFVLAPLLPAASGRRAGASPPHASTPKNAPVKHAPAAASSCEAEADACEDTRVHVGLGEADARALRHRACPDRHQVELKHCTELRVCGRGEVPDLVQGIEGNARAADEVRCRTKARLGPNSSHSRTCADRSDCPIRSLALVLENTVQIAQRRAFSTFSPPSPGSTQRRSTGSSACDQRSLPREWLSYQQPRQPLARPRHVGQGSFTLSGPAASRGSLGSREELHARDAAP